MSSECRKIFWKRLLSWLYNLFSNCNMNMAGLLTFSSGASKNIIEYLLVFRTEEVSIYSNLMYPLSTSYKQLSTEDPLQHWHQMCRLTSNGYQDSPLRWTNQNMINHLSLSKGGLPATFFRRDFLKPFTTNLTFVQTILAKKIKHTIDVNPWYGCFRKLGVPPNHPILIGISIIFTIHFGVSPIFGNNHMSMIISPISPPVAG